MYVYNDYWNSTNAILLYPTKEVTKPVIKKFHNRNHWCGLAWVNVVENGKINHNIGQDIRLALLNKYLSFVPEKVI